MFSSRWTRLALACVMCTLPGLAHAQTGETNTRVFSSLFGGAATDMPGSVQALDFSAAVFGGYDDDIFARGSRPRTDAARLSGTFTGVQGGLQYRRRMARGSFGARAATAARLVSSTGEFVTTFAAGQARYSTDLTTRTSTTIWQRVLYRPYFSVVPFATGSTLGPSVEGVEPDDIADFADGVDQGAGGESDFALAADREAIIYGGGGGLARQLSIRSSLQFTASYSTARFLQDDARTFGNVRWRAGGLYQYRISRYLTFNAGYAYRQFLGKSGADAVNHDINLGVRYNQPFTFGRGRTTLSFTTGSTTLIRDRLEEEGGRGDRFIWRALGSATLRHDFSGPWQAQVSYIRSVGFLDGLTDPFVGDRVVAVPRGAQLVERVADLGVRVGDGHGGTLGREDEGQQRDHQRGVPLVQQVEHGVPERPDRAQVRPFDSSDHRRTA